MSKYGTQGFVGTTTNYYHPPVKTMQIPDIDASEVMYSCGHRITVPNAALMTLGHQAAIPPRCVTCEQLGMNKKWVDQQEAKLWATDPNWAGFPPVTAASAASATTVTTTMEAEQGPLAWLNYQVESITRRAWL